jgi:hypothetical protein
MPIHSLKIPFAQMRGTIRDGNPRTGLSVTDAPTEGHNSRRYNPHQPPGTPAQRKIRTYTAASAKAWSALPAATAAAWRTLATQITRDNSLGYAYHLTGIGLWNQVQHYRQLDGQSIDATVPDPLDVPGPASTPITFEQDGAIITAKVKVNLAPNGSKVLWRATNSSTNQSRLRQPHELRIPTTSTPNSFATFAANWAIVSFTPDTITTTPAEFVGLSYTIMSAAYLPRPPLFIPLHVIETP